jgi:hypothetical protein
MYAYANFSMSEILNGNSTERMFGIKEKEMLDM